MLFQQDTGLTDEQIVGELFKNFVDTDDPAFLSSPESDFEFIQPPPSSSSTAATLPMSSNSSPITHEESYGVVPLSSGPSPPIDSQASSSSADLYPRINKKPRNTPDIEKWTPYIPPVRQYFSLYNAHSEELGNSIDVRTKIDKVDQREHYSGADEAYILYRQNQFQLDVDMFGTLGNYSSNPPTPSAASSAPVAPSTPLYVDIGGMLVPVECLYYHIYSVKQHKGVPVETSTDQEQLVDLVQLGGPRNRKDFQLPGLCPILQGRATYGRLQFRAATPNNARVHPDQPNPNQQYYRIVLSLVAKTATSLNFIFSKISPCFMVRGQNPGKFNTTGGSKPLTPPSTITKQEFPSYPPPSPYPPQQTPQQPQPQPQHFQQHQHPSIPQFDQLSPNNNNLSPTTTNLSPIPHANPTVTTAISNSYPLTPAHYNTFKPPVNPNPAQLPQLVSHGPGSPARGAKRPAGLGEGEGWSSDQYGNVYMHGKVGINTSDPSEALSVQGNILVTGDVLKPSDQRIKENIVPLSGKTQLENVERLKLYEYDLKHSVDVDGQPVRERGVLAQELQTVMPNAVRVLKNVTLADGTVMPELLVVHDRALLFENIGATQELSRSVNEQKSRIDTLSESFAHGMHEVQVGTKRAVRAMAHMVSFMLTEGKRDYKNSIFFLSVFGLGPAWTMYLLGFFFPPLWFFGLFYIASVVSVKKTAGFVHFGTMVVFVIYAGLILAYDMSPKQKILAILVPQYLGVIVTVVFGIYFCRKQNERELYFGEEIFEDYDYTRNTGNSESLLLPPEAFLSSGWTNKNLEYGKLKEQPSPDPKGKQKEEKKG